MNMFAKALEIIPRTIADNAGLDSLELINKLRSRHRKHLLNQIKEETKTYSKVLISMKELQIIKRALSGSLFW